MRLFKEQIKFAYWALLFPLSILTGLVGRILSPIVCCFVYRSWIHDTVKRHNKQKITLHRDKIIPALTWFDTDDNCTDGYWYGMYKGVRIGGWAYWRK